MIRKLTAITCAILALALGLLSGCSFHKSMSYTYNVATGDTIEVELDTSDGFRLNVEGSAFTVTYAGNDTREAAGYDILVGGIFLTASDYDAYKSSYSESNDYSYTQETICGYNGFSVVVSDASATERDYFIRVSQNTGIMMGAIASENVVKEVLSALTFTVANGTPYVEEPHAEPVTVSEPTPAPELSFPTPTVSETTPESELPAQGTVAAPSEKPVATSTPATDRVFDSALVGYYEAILLNDEPIQTPQETPWMLVNEDGSVVFFDGSQTLEMQIDGDDLVNGFQSRCPITRSQDGNTLVVNLDWDAIFVFERAALPQIAKAI